MSDQRTEKGVEHTPGPWTPCKAGECICGLIYGDGGKAFVAQAFNANNRDEHGCPDPVPIVESGKANARLIAAAPEMLEALEWLAHAACDVSKDGGRCTTQEWSDAVDNAIKVIEKAKGTDDATG